MLQNCGYCIFCFNIAALKHKKIMNIYAVLMGIAGAVFVINKIYRTSGKVVFTESDTATEVKLANVNEVVAAELTKGDQVSFQESAVPGEVFVKAKTKAGVYENIGVVNDTELYRKVQQKRARGKIAAAQGAEVVISYSFS